MGAGAYADSFAAADRAVEADRVYEDPCVGYDRLYEEYRDQGLLIVGVFSSADMDDDVREIISDNGIKYPVVRQMGELASFRAQYVPTTIFTDGSGNLISSEPIVGAKSFSEWESIIKLYLD